MSIGLPQVIIDFAEKAQSIIKRSERGVVAVILKDDTADAIPFQICKSLNDVDFTKLNEKNYQYLKLVFEGAPAKVIIVTQKTSAATYTASLAQLVDYKWNYLTVPGADQEATTTLVSWMKEQRTANKKTFKAVFAGTAADNEGIINYTTDKVVSTITGTEVTLSAAEYCARIAGIAAGLPLSRSMTYYKLADIISAETPADAEERIGKGELITIYDGENFKIGRGVNSLTSGKSDDLRKIKIIEGRDMIKEDIKTTFENDYVGQVINDYDHKQAFVAAILKYFRGIQGDVLDSNAENTVSISLEKQKAYLEMNEIDTDKMSDAEILSANTGSKIMLEGKIKLVDAMEDLDLSLEM